MPAQIAEKKDEFSRNGLSCLCNFFFFCHCVCVHCSDGDECASRPCLRSFLYSPGGCAIVREVLRPQVAFTRAHCVHKCAYMCVQTVTNVPVVRVSTVGRVWMAITCTRVYVHDACRPSLAPTVKTVRHVIRYVMLSSLVCTRVDIALLEWVNEYAVRAYTIPGSAVSYLNHARMA